MEQPTFNEAQLDHLNSNPLKISRESFSRSQAFAQAPSHLQPIFQELFDKIDRLDLVICYYDLAHGKRKKPPRESLLAKFTPEERIELQERSNHFNQFSYLKARHELVNLRRQQYTYKDCYQPVIQRHTLPQTL